MTAPQRPIASDALEANLSLTRVEVVIPEEDTVLLQSVERYFRVHELARSTLIEYHHPFRNTRDVIEGLRTLCGGMLHYYEGSSDPQRSISRLNALLCGLYDPDLGEDDVIRLVETHLELLGSLATSARRQDYEPTLAHGLSRIIGETDLHQSAFIVHAAGLRALGRALDWEPNLHHRAAGLFAQLIERTLAQWQRFLDQPDRRVRLELDSPSPSSAALRLQERLRSTKMALEAADEPTATLELPSPDDLLSSLLHDLDSSDPNVPGLDSLTLLVELLPLSHLRRHRNEILRQLYFSLRSVCARGSAQQVGQAVDMIPALLSSSDVRVRPWLYRGLELLGRELVRRSESGLIQRFMEHLTVSAFEPPDIGGGTETWEVRVNPNHLTCLKTWLAIIGSGPARYERLLSALTVHIHFRGVFVKDTDLLHRDVSALLSSGLGSSFNLALQLARHLPVFFNALGSEGELREVSTRIDQITLRRDPIIHYLRKQSHAESNSRLVEFTRAIARAWSTGDTAVLAPFLPPTVLSAVSPDDPWLTGARIAMDRLAAAGIGPDELPETPPSRLEAALGQPSGEDPVHRQRVLLLTRLWRLLRAKYEYDPGQIVPSVSSCPHLDPELREAFVQAFSDEGDGLSVLRQGNAVLDALRRIATDPHPTTPDERIYHKRHIAVGIPSVYGSYHEPRFDALGLMLRLMRFLKPRLERCLADFPTGFMTRFSLGRAHELMFEMLRGLAACGLRVRDLSQQIALLEEIAALPSPTIRQYLDILDLISEALVRTVEVNFLAPHEPNLRLVLPRIVEDRGIPEHERAAAVGSLSEEFLRSAVASTYALQELDRFVARIRDSLTSMVETLGEEESGRVLAYRPDRLIVHLGEHEPSGAPVLHLGSKGFGLVRLRDLGFPVPEGFIISTRLFRLLPALEHAELADDTRMRILAAVERLERETGLTLGDPAAPLLVSIRSGAAFTMPGVLDTILNVGLTEELAEAVARRGGPAWTMWDCWRRSIQNFAMSNGVDRDLFDGIMVDFKRRYGVTRKVEFEADQMREMARVYRDSAVERGVALLSDPREQLLQAVFLVLASWESQTARIYRQRLGLADTWGTGVIVQRMVFGNLSTSAGSGVVFTRDPWSSGTGVNLYGDFTSCSQGEDVVAGLVHPLPVSEEQRVSRQAHEEGSLESLFPAVYARLHAIAERLVGELGFEHQELEFTFESDRPEDVHILQTRSLRLLRHERTTVFADGDSLLQHRLGRGTGVAGGALSGRIVFGHDDLNRLRREAPDCHLILIRPDTVPEDLPLILEAEGLLTARGGATSHAAITARRLGKVCVVNCLDLEVNEGSGTAVIGGRRLESGDHISIDGLLGNVYAGRHEVIQASAGGLPLEGGLI